MLKIFSDILFLMIFRTTFEIIFEVIFVSLFGYFFRDLAVQNVATPVGAGTRMVPAPTGVAKSTSFILPL